MRAAAAVVLAISMLLLVFLTRGRSLPVESASPSFSIRVEIDGVPQSSFRGVEGIEIEKEILEVRDGTSNAVRKVPGVTKMNLITLKMDPVPHGDSLWTWFNSVLAGDASIRRNMSVILLQDDKELRRYNFFRAWPAKWEGWRQVSPNATSPVESVGIAFEAMERVQ
jgi:phage tail-like protein